MTAQVLTLEGAKRRGARWCDRCGQWLPAHNFKKDPRVPGGRRGRCHHCVDAARKLARALPPVELMEPVTISLVPIGERCATCLHAGPFVLTTGERACARCLKLRVKRRVKRRVKERRGE